MDLQLLPTPAIAAAAAGLAAARAAHLVVARDCDLRTMLARGDPSKLHGRVVWLAAAHRPLSHALARRLAGLGACVVLSGAADTEAHVLALAKELTGMGPCPAVALVPQPADPAAAARAAAHEFGRLDIIVLDTAVAPSHVAVDAAHTVRRALPQLRLATGWGAAIVHVGRLNGGGGDGALRQELARVRDTEGRVRVVDVLCGAALCDDADTRPDGSDAGVSDAVDSAAERVLAAVSGGLTRVVLGGVGERVSLWTRGRERWGAHERVPLLDGGSGSDGDGGSKSSSGTGNINGIFNRERVQGRDDETAAVEATMRRVQLMAGTEMNDRPWLE